MKEQLDVILKGFNYKLHFIIPNPGAGNKPTGGYEVIDEVFQGQTVWHSDLSSEDAILHMMNADLLVTSPSSFCFLATTFSAKPVVLFDTPKDGDHGVSTQSLPLFVVLSFACLYSRLTVSPLYTQTGLQRLQSLCD